MITAYKYHLKKLREFTGLSQTQFIQYMTIYGGHLLDFTTISRHENIKPGDKRRVSDVNLSYYTAAFKLDAIDLYRVYHTQDNLLQRLLEAWGVDNLDQFQEHIQTLMVDHEEKG